MITKTEKKRLKKHLKNDYVEDVKKELASKNILSRNLEPYSDSMIRMVLNGHKENQDIEDALLMVFETRKEAFEQRQENKSKILAN